MNPRYLAYCSAHGHGRTPEEMMAYDQQRYPGRCMAGFIAWINDMWREFEQQHKARRIGKTPATDVYMWRLAHADAFDAWLLHDFPSMVNREKTNG